MKNILIGFSPLIAGLLVKKIFKVLGLGELMKLSGALMSGAAGVGKLAGDHEFGTKHAANIDKGISKHGNKIGKKFGNDKLGDNIANGSLASAAKVMTKHATNPRGALAKAKHHKENAAIAKHLNEEAKLEKKNKRNEHLTAITDKRAAKIKSLEEKSPQSSQAHNVEELESDSAVGMIAAVGVAKEKNFTDHNPDAKNKTGKVAEALTGQNFTEDNLAMELTARNRRQSEEITINQHKGKKDARKAINNVYNNRAEEIISNSGLGGRALSEIDRAATTKQIAKITGLPAGNISLPNNGFPPLLGLSSSGAKMILPENLDQARNIASLPYHYYPDEIKRRRLGESEEAHSGRLHQIMISKGDYDPVKNVYTNMVSKNGISDSDIKLAIAGTVSKLDVLNIEVNSSQASNATTWSKQFDAANHFETAKEIFAHSKSLERKVEIHASVVSAIGEPLPITANSGEVLKLINSGAKLNGGELMEHNRTIKSNIVEVLDNQSSVFVDQMKALASLSSYAVASSTDFKSEESSKKAFEHAKAIEKEYELKLTKYEEEKKAMLKSIGANSTPEFIANVYSGIEAKAIYMQKELLLEKELIEYEFQTARKNSSLTSGSDVKVNSGKNGRKMITARNFFEPLGLTKEA